jgi:predicted transcriptional regulator
MPVIKITPERVALARVLADANWTHARIAGVFGVTRGAITHALNDRKTLLPTEGNTLAAAVVARVIERSHRAALRAVSAELRTLADEMDKEADAA